MDDAIGTGGEWLVVVVVVVVVVIVVPLFVLQSRLLLDRSGCSSNSTTTLLLDGNDQSLAFSHSNEGDETRLGTPHNYNYYYY